MRPLEIWGGLPSVHFPSREEAFLSAGRPFFSFFRWLPFLPRAGKQRGRDGDVSYVVRVLRGTDQVVADGADRSRHPRGGWHLSHCSPHHAIDARASPSCTLAGQPCAIPRVFSLTL